MKIVVVGASRGLGKSLSAMLVEGGHQVVEGHRVILGGETNQTQVDCDNRVVKEGGRIPLQMDVTNEKQMQEAAEKIKNAMETIDVVVHVAGVLLPSDRTDTLMTEPIADIEEQFHVNALGLLISFRSLYPIIKKGGRFIAVTSEGGSFTLEGELFPAYGISKTAANKIVQVLRKTVTDIDIIAVHPGRMNTEMGKATAQIETIEAARGFVQIIEGNRVWDTKKDWFIDYQGQSMKL